MFKSTTFMLALMIVLISHTLTMESFAENLLIYRFKAIQSPSAQKNDDQSDFLQD